MEICQLLFLLQCSISNGNHFCNYLSVILLVHWRRNIMKRITFFYFLQRIPQPFNLVSGFCLVWVILGAYPQPFNNVHHSPPLLLWRWRHGPFHLPPCFQIQVQYPIALPPTLHFAGATVQSRQRRLTCHRCQNPNWFATVQQYPSLTTQCLWFYQTIRTHMSSLVHMQDIPTISPACY